MRTSALSQWLDNRAVCGHASRVAALTRVVRALLTDGRLSLTFSAVCLGADSVQLERSFRRDLRRRSGAFQKLLSELALRLAVGLGAHADRVGAPERFRRVRSVLLNRRQVARALDGLDLVHAGAAWE